LIELTISRMSRSSSVRAGGGQALVLQQGGQQLGALLTSRTAGANTLGVTEGGALWFAFSLAM
jgi:hypothetical protein